VGKNWGYTFVLTKTNYMNNIIKKTNENIEGFMNKLSKFNITSHLTNDEKNKL